MIYGGLEALKGFFLNNERSASNLALPVRSMIITFNYIHPTSQTQAQNKQAITPNDTEYRTPGIPP